MDEGDAVDRDRCTGDHWKGMASLIINTCLLNCKILACEAHCALETYPNEKFRIDKNHGRKH